MNNFDYNRLFGEIPHKLHVPLFKHTGFRTGGAADCMIWPRSEQELAQTVSLLRANGIPYYILGNGSNVLALDDGYRGCIIKTEDALRELSVNKDGTVVCGAGVQLSFLCNECAKKELTGLEFAYGIPGTVGGALYMNAGAYDGEMKDVVRSVRALLSNGETVTLSAEEMRFSYRHSAAHDQDMIILAAEIVLTKGDPSAIRDKMNDLMNRRREKQPLDKPSCGSTFKRPVGAYAAKLIDDCGLRGYRHGGAQVSEKHCGFVINAGGATSADILALCDDVKAIVFEKTGFTLEHEIRILR